MLALVVLAAAVADVPRPELVGLSLKVSTTKSILLVGEPLRLVVTWSVSRPLDVAINQFRLFIDDGRSVREWNETALAIDEEIELATRLEPGRPQNKTRVIGVSGAPRFSGANVTTERLAFAFPKPGAYRIRADYAGVVSPWLKVRAVRPAGLDAELFEQQIKPHPHILSEYCVLLGEGFLRNLFQRYPRSPYLLRTKLMFFARKLDEGSSVGTLIEELARDDFGISPFDEVRRHLLATMRARYAEEAATSPAH